MDWVAITGIVVSGLLGPSVAAIWVQRNQGARFRQELVLHDRAELRDLVDELAQALEQADVGLRLAWLAETESDEEEVDKRLFDDFGSVAMLRERIAMRLGVNHDVTRNLDAALSELRWVSTWRGSEKSKEDPGGRRTEILYAMERFRESRQLALAYALPLVASYIKVPANELNPE